MNYRTYSDGELLNEAYNCDDPLVSELYLRLKRAHDANQKAHSIMCDVINTIDCYGSEVEDEILQMKAQSTWLDLQRASDFISGINRSY